MAKKSTEQVPEKASAPPDEVYVVVNPITYGDPEIRHEAGSEISGIPLRSIPWLLDQGHILRKGGE